MGKNKLERFAENATFKNLIQLSYEEITNLGQCPFKGKWRSEFFGNDKPIVLELGCGKGEYTVGLARKYPEKNFIGIDKRCFRSHTYTNDNFLLRCKRSK